MTFYIPPVFLFGNKVRHIKHNQERNKAEYKTATETGIKIENRNIKRIEELEKENKKLKIIIENNELEQKADWKHIEELEEENRNLKNELMEDMKTESKLNEEIRNLKSELSKFRDSFKKYRDYEKEELAESCYDLARENQKLRAEVRDLVERNIELDKKYTFVLSKLRR